MASAFVEDGVRRLVEQAIQPQYDGSYLNHETGQWHDTWVIRSGTNEDHAYILDLERHTGTLHCTCPGANDYSKPCKHRELFWRSAI